MSKYILAYDIGTTGVKTCLFEVDKSIELLSYASRSYQLYMVDGGGVEQECDDWWKGMAESTAEVLANARDIKPDMIAGISFCSQMQGLVLVDRNGEPVRRPMSYLDKRAGDEFRKGMGGVIEIAGADVKKLVPSLRITGAFAGSVKDPVWKYKWVESREPDIFSRVYKWLDVKDYLILRCTGNFTMTPDSAFGTMLYDNRPGGGCWSAKVCDMLGVNMDHLPDIIDAADVAGTLTAKAAMELGLSEGTPVYGGGGDVSLIGVGAGAVSKGDTHVYIGTSGWVVTITDRRKVDVTSMIAAIVGADRTKYNYFAEMETAGKCLEWVKDHLAKDEIGIYVEKEGVPEGYESRNSQLYTYMTEVIRDVEPGSGGLLFAPWLHGNRCPFEDPAARGMFIGIGLDTGKTEMIHAVLEGVFYHIRWMLECQERSVKTSKVIRFAGGGALSPVSCQMLADILGRTLETVRSPQNAGSFGACAVTAVGLGIIPDLEAVKDYIRVDETYVPDMDKHRAYKPYYKTFKKLYSSNKGILRMLAKAGK